MRGSGEHIAADFDSVCGDADADGIYAGINHGFEVTTGLNPVRHRLLCSSAQSCSCEHRQVAAEAMLISMGQNCFALQSGFVGGIHPFGVVLRRIHEGLIDR